MAYKYMIGLTEPLYDRGYIASVYDMPNIACTWYGPQKQQLGALWTVSVYPGTSSY